MHKASFLTRFRFSYSYALLVIAAEALLPARRQRNAEATRAMRAA